MANLYKRVKGRTIPQFIAKLDGVQVDLEARTFEIAVRAEEALLKHRREGHSQIEVDHGDIDWYVTLNDDRGQKAAMSIEYGRAAYDMVVKNPHTGEEFIKHIDASDGLYILANAAHLPRKRKGKVVV